VPEHASRIARVKGLVSGAHKGAAPMTDLDASADADASTDADAGAGGASGAVEDAADPDLDAWVAVVTQRLGREIGPGRRLSRVSRGRISSALSRSARAADHDLDPELAPLLQLIGLDSAKHGASAREFAAIVDRSEGAGLQRGALPQILQAYVRAISRIVSVESAIGIDVLRRVVRRRELPNPAFGEQSVATLRRR
jgi:hypothetical protein